MTMRLSILIDANGKAAIAEVEKLGSAVTKAGAATEQMGRKGASAAGGTRSLATAARSADVAVDSLTAAQNANAASAANMQRANRGAAGATGNLIAQFNDIGVMLAAGQNPLQLAIQQGTQITQVIGPMGARGAVQALGGAFLGMLNPISLVTLGVIAAGAALFQWGRNALGAGAEAETFEDRLERVANAVDRYRELSDEAAASTSELRQRFGQAGAEGRSILAFLEALAASEAQRQIDGISASLSELMGIRGDGDRRAGIADFFNVDIMLAFNSAQREARGEARALTAEFQGQQEALAEAGGDLERQIAALERMRTAAVALADADGRRSAAEDSLLAQLGETLLLMYEQRAAVDDVSASLTAQEFQLQAQIGFNTQRRDIIQQIAVAEAAYVDQQADAQARNTASAQQLLADMQAQSQMAAIIALFGDDSAEAAAMRAQQERAAFDALVDSLNPADDLRAQLYAAYENAELIAQANPAGPIAAAASAAAQLAANLGISVGHASQLLRLRGNQTEEVIFDPRHERYDATRAEMARLAEGAGRISPFDPVRNRAPRAGSSGTGRGSGGASAATTERDAVQELIESLNDELELLHETDPVMQEMIRHREVLANATEAERNQVQDLIATREAEEESIRRLEERTEFLRTTSRDLIDDLTDGTGSWDDALKSVGNTLRRVALDALLLGEGPLAGFLGFAGDSGLLGLFADAITPAANTNAVPALAGGGMIYGPGGPSDDKVLMFGSAGEMVMNGRATRDYRHVLEAMNAGGHIPGFANGGAINGTGSGDALFGAPVINIVNRGSTPVSGEVEESRDASGRRSYRLILADEVGAALQTKGGGANRALKRSFGVRPVGTQR